MVVNAKVLHALYRNKSAGDCIDIEPQEVSNTMELVSSGRPCRRARLVGSLCQTQP